MAYRTKYCARPDQKAGTKTTPRRNPTLTSTFPHLPLEIIFSQTVVLAVNPLKIFKILAGFRHLTSELARKVYRPMLCRLHSFVQSGQDRGYIYRVSPLRKSMFFRQKYADSLKTRITVQMREKTGVCVQMPEFWGAYAGL